MRTIITWPDETTAISVTLDEAKRQVIIEHRVLRGQQRVFAGMLTTEGKGGQTVRQLMHVHTRTGKHALGELNAEREAAPDFDLSPAAMAEKQRLVAAKIKDDK